MPNACMSTSGERLRQAREEAGFKTAAEAARRLKVAYPTYAGHENGNRGFGGNIDLYAHTFKVRGEWLRTGAGGMKPGEKSLVEELYDSLPPDIQSEVINYMRFRKAG